MNHAIWKSHLTFLTSTGSLRPSNTISIENRLYLLSSLQSFILSMLEVVYPPRTQGITRLIALNRGGKSFAINRNRTFGFKLHQTSNTMLEDYKNMSWLLQELAISST